MDRHFVHNRLLRIIPAVLWMLGIFVSSSQSRVPQAPGLSGELTAIVGHLVAYAVLAILVAWGIGVDFASLSARRTIIAFAITVLYGVSDEFHQSFVPGRYATIEDVLTNAIGAAAGLTAMHAAACWRRERSTA